MQNLATFEFFQPEAATNLRGELTSLAQGSRNLLPLGRKQLKPFRGLFPVGTGSRQLFLLRNTFGGLNDTDIGGIRKPGGGSLFSYIADSLWFCGQGNVSVAGAEIPNVTASSLLRVLLKWNNSYTEARSGPYLVGLPEPSVPEIGLLDNPPGDAPQMNGNYAFQYARMSKLNGRSRASGSTPIINVPQGRGVWMKIPLPTTNTDKHVIFVTKRQDAGLGRTLRLSRANVYTKAEFTESDVERDISVTVTNGSEILSAPAGTFTFGDIGKRVHSQTSGISIPFGTTIITVLSDSQVRLSNAVSGNGAAIFDCISYVNGIDRAVALNWKETEVISEFAWIYDFPPMPCSHAFALGKRIYLIAYADSASEASSEQTGTALVPSLPNQPESFDLRYPLYLQERVVDVQTRQMASYVFLGCENGIYSVQEIGTELTPATISTVLQGEGIKHAKNWAFSKNALYCASADGKLIRLIGNGDVDTSFAEPIAYLIRDAKQEDMVVGADPHNDGVTLSVGNISYFYDEQTGRWSSELFLNDTYRGNVISAIGANSKLHLTLDDDGVHTLYEFDRGNPTDTLTLSPFVATNGNFQKVINRFALQFVCDRTDKIFYFAIHANNLQTHVKSANVTSNLIVSAEGEFTPEMRNSCVLIRKSGIGGGWHFARIAAVLNTTTLQLDGNAPMDATNVYVLIAKMIFPLRVNRKGTHQIESPEIFINNLTSFAVSLLTETTGRESQLLKVEVDGEVTGEQWFNSSASVGFIAATSPYQEIENQPDAPRLTDLPSLFN